MTNLLFQILYTILPSVLQIIVTLAVLAIFDWRVSLTALVFIIAYLIIALKENVRFFPKIEAVRKRFQTESKMQSELYRNSTLVISEAQEARTIDDFRVFSEDVADFFYFHLATLPATVLS